MGRSLGSWLYEQKPRYHSYDNLGNARLKTLKLIYAPHLVPGNLAKIKDGIDDS
jgi:hypothetical protein